MHNEPYKLAPGVGNDMDSWDLAYEAAQQLPYHSAASYTEEVTQIGYEKVPVSYILTEKDVIVTPGKFRSLTHSSLTLIAARTPGAVHQ